MDVIILKSKLRLEKLFDIAMYIVLYRFKFKMASNILQNAFWEIEIHMELKSLLSNIEIETNIAKWVIIYWNLFEFI